MKILPAMRAKCVKEISSELLTDKTIFISWHFSLMTFSVNKTLYYASTKVVNNKLSKIVVCKVQICQFVFISQLKLQLHDAIYRLRFY